MHINICQLEGLHPKTTTAATAELKHSDIRRLRLYWQDVCHLGGRWYCHIFVSNRFHLKTKRRNFCFISRSYPVPPNLERRDPRHPICCGWSWSWRVPPRGIAQDGAQKSGNTRSRSARGLAQLSWCWLVPLAVQQKLAKKNGQRFFGTKKFVTKSRQIPWASSTI